jgi:hypothetical protein
MFRLVVLTCVIAAAAAQGIDPKDAKILKEQRFNAGDGRAGAAFATEDGHVFREETDINGNRLGEYSYIGENGQTYTVKYSAGKDGFRVLDGTHVPSNGQGAAAFDAQDLEEEVQAPVQVAQPVQQQQPRPQPVPVQSQPQPKINDYDDVEEIQDPNFNPFVNPHDPTHRDFAFNSNAAQFAPKGAQAGNVNPNLVPNCADCAGVNPFINPFDASHNQAGLLAGQQAFAASRATPPQLRQQPQQVQQVAPQQQVQQVQQLPVLREQTTTHSPRIFPPGELKLNRFETGFNFDFQS